MGESSEDCAGGDLLGSIEQGPLSLQDEIVPQAELETLTTELCGSNSEERERIVKSLPITTAVGIARLLAFARKRVQVADSERDRVNEEDLASVIVKLRDSSPEAGRKIMKSLPLSTTMALVRLVARTRLTAKDNRGQDDRCLEKVMEGDGDEP